jgi:hypothetical protein
MTPSKTRRRPIIVPPTADTIVMFYVVASEIQKTWFFGRMARLASRARA